MRINWSIWYQLPIRRLLAQEVWVGSPLGLVSYTRWRLSFWASPSFEQILLLLIRVVQVIEFNVHITERGFISLKIFSLKMFFENNKGWGPMIIIYFILRLTNWIKISMHTWENLKGWHLKKKFFFYFQVFLKYFLFFLHVSIGWG